jgi:hypothetical protein
MPKAKSGHFDLLNMDCFLPVRTLADGPKNLTATKLQMASKICSTTAADGNELARLVRCPLYSLL